MKTEAIVRAALKEKSPALFAQLSAAGTLAAFVRDQATEINEQIATLTMEIAAKNGLNHKPEPSYQDKVGITNQARSLASETVFAEMLDFPPDETFRKNPDEIMSSATAT